MSAPPPPPPPAPPPVRPETATSWMPQDPREQRRVARAQRASLRQQARSFRRSSVLGPLLLVGLGVLFLLLEMGRLRYDAVWSWMSRWWPAVLLLAGLVLLAEWAADTWVASPSQPAAPRRSVGPLGVLLLVLITAVGAGSMMLRQEATWMGQNWNPGMAETWGLEQIFAQHSEVNEDLTAAMPRGTLLLVKNYQGDINVTGDSSDGQVHVTVHQHLIAWRRNDLRARQRRDRVRLQRDGDHLLLFASGQGRDRTDLTISMPHEGGLDIGSETGQLTLSEIHGAITVRDHAGNLVLTGLTGPIHIAARDDDATVTGHSLSGEITLQGRTGDLNFTDVTGPLTLHGDFFGTTHLERISGPVHFQSSFTDLTCASLPGELNVEGRSELQARNVEGPLVVATTDRNLLVSDVRKGAQITDRNGSVSLGLADLLSPVSITTTAGSVDVRVPSQASFSLSAETEDGKIENDLGLHPQKDGDHVILRAKVRKGGSEMTLRTDAGDITVHSKAAAEADDSEAKSTNADGDDD